MAIARRLIAFALASAFLGNTGCFWEGREHGERHAGYYGGDDNDRYEREHRFHHHDDEHEHEHEHEGRGMGGD